MAPARHHPRDAAGHRGISQPELRPHGLAGRVGREALHIHGARHDGHAGRGRPHGAQPLRDALADRDQRIGLPEEPAGGRPGVRGPAMVHGADQPRPRAAASQRRQPVVVGLVGVDQVDLELS